MMDADDNAYAHHWLERVAYWREQVAELREKEATAGRATRGVYADLVERAAANMIDCVDRFYHSVSR